MLSRVTGASPSFLVKQPGGLGYKLHSKCSKARRFLKLTRGIIHGPRTHAACPRPHTPETSADFPFPMRTATPTSFGPVTPCNLKPSTIGHSEPRDPRACNSAPTPPHALIEGVASSPKCTGYAPS